MIVTRYAVTNGKLWVGSKRYSYRTGTYAGLSPNPSAARLFTRKADAENALEKGFKVVPVEVHFPD